MSALDLARRALEIARATADAEVLVQTERSGMARFAASEVHQPTLIENTTVQIRVAFDGNTGTAVTNRVDDGALAAAADRAREAAAPDPEFAGFAGAADVPQTEAYDEATARLAPGAQAEAASRAFHVALPVYGFFTTGETEIAVATSAGFEDEQRLTDATVRVLAATEGASGWAERTSWRAADVDVAAVAREAAAKAERTRGAVRPEPAKVRAVLEPYAIAELLQYFAFSTWNGRALLEERSFATGRIGERAFAPSVTIHDDRVSHDGLPRRFDYEGTPVRRLPLVEDGVLRGVCWDRRTARRGGTDSTGHAPPPAERGSGPYPTALRLEGGDASSLDELAEVVGDGIHVTRCHYLGIVQPREGVLTGMTRDGTFAIRGGKVAEPLVNLRFTVSMPELLRDVLALTRDTMLVSQSDFYDDRYAIAARVPALATASFNVTGTGSEPGL